MMNLDSFLVAAANSKRVLSAQIYYPGFTYLYVRGLKAYVKGEWRSPIITIANIEAAKRGNGAWRRLEADLVGRQLGIYVENILNDRWLKSLLADGYELVGTYSQTVAMSATKLAVLNKER